MNLLAGLRHTISQAQELGAPEQPGQAAPRAAGQHAGQPGASLTISFPIKASRPAMQPADTPKPCRYKRYGRLRKLAKERYKQLCRLLGSILPLAALRFDRSSSSAS